MKFTDGYWQVREGMTLHSASQVHEVEVEPDAITVYAATKRLVTRADTLNLPLLTIRFSTPMESVIRVQLYHHKSGIPQKPQFHITEQPDLQPVIMDDEQSATLTSGQLSVHVHKGDPWLVEYKAGERVITSSAWRGM